MARTLPKTLTDKQRAVFTYLKDTYMAQGRTAGIYDIGQHFGFSATAARDHLRAIERKGYIAIERGKSRAIRILKELPPAIKSVEIVPEGYDRRIIEVPIYAANRLANRLQHRLPVNSAVLARRYLGDNGQIDDCFALQVDASLNTHAVCDRVFKDDLLFILTDGYTLGAGDLLLTDTQQIEPFRPMSGQKIDGKVIYLQRGVS